tara:strand:- start:8048 stop:8236 length:189 start_codon:yes stop_codon:yes gene_type:complete
MQHYKAITLISERITELNLEVANLKKISEEQKGFAGYVFAKNDIENMLLEVKELTVTLKELI